MNGSLHTVGMLIGGLGLFLLAVGMLTDGLKSAAGNALRGLLGRCTRSPIYGVLTGVAITAIVQSSSAVTVATIGFVNAGLLSVRQAIGIVYGSNIGTTMTAWLVAVIGFQINVESFAFPLVGAGMLLRLTGGHSRRAAVGMALAGFGLFFIGVDTLKTAFDGLATAIDLQRFTLDGIAGVFIYVGIGTLMTILTQSSSAAIAIILTATSGGIVGLYAAAAMIIGANVGTTSTAVVSVIGATSNAKRVAAAHIIFNIATGVVALLSLPLLFMFVKKTGTLFGLADIPAVTLALFHTAFNILGVLLMWPFTERLADFLGRRFVTQEEIEGRPRFLDNTVAVSPTLAVNAVALELCRLTTFVQRVAYSVLESGVRGTRSINRDHEVVEKLAIAVTEFISSIEKDSLSAEVAEQLKLALRVEQHLTVCMDHALEIHNMVAHSIRLDDKEVNDALAAFRAEVHNLFELSDVRAEGFSIDLGDKQLERVRAAYYDVKGDLLHAAVAARIPISMTVDILEQNSRIRYMAEEIAKAALALSDICRTVDVTLEQNPAPVTSTLFDDKLSAVD